MKYTLLLLAGPVALLVGIGLFLVVLRSQRIYRIYALGSVTAEFTFRILDEETREPVARATIDIWDAPVTPAEPKKIAQLIADDSGVAKYLREDTSVEEVIGISGDYKLEGVRRHPEGVGTFVDRFWCTLDITANGYIPLEDIPLGFWRYDDNGYDREAEIHRFEFMITMRRE